MPGSRSRVDFAPSGIPSVRSSTAVSRGGWGRSAGRHGQPRDAARARRSTRARPVACAMSRPGSDQNVGVTAEREPAPVSLPAPAPQLGGLTRRRRPAAGLRPTVRFAIAGPLTVAWVAFGVWASGPWRDELEQAIGPVMAWVIPLMLAYIPGVVIGFMASRLISPLPRPPLAAAGALAGG